MMTLTGCLSTVTVLNIVKKDIKGGVSNICHRILWFFSHDHGVTGKALWGEVKIIKTAECMEILKGS